MTDPAPPRPLADLFDAGDTVMVMTMIGDRHSSRPMTIADVTGDRLGLLVDTTAAWTTAIEAGRAAAVHVTKADVRANTYCSLNGTATMTRDRSEIERLWNPAASAFFEGQEDPHLAVLHFDVSDGEFWDSPGGRIGSLVAMVRAAVGGDESAGDHGPVGSAG